MLINRGRPLFMRVNDSGAGSGGGTGSGGSGSGEGGQGGSSGAGGGAGGSGDGSGEGGAGGAGNSSQGQNGGGNSGGDGGGSGGAKVIQLTEAQLKEREDALAARVRQETERSFDKKLEKQKADAEAAELKAKGEWEKLFNQEKARADSLQVQADQAASLANVFHGNIDAEIAEWPAELKAMDPGRNASVEARNTWLTNSRVIAKRLAAGGAPPEGEHNQGRGGSGGGSGSNGQKALTESLDKLITGGSYAVPGQKKE